MMTKLWRYTVGRHLSKVACFIALSVLLVAGAQETPEAEEALEVPAAPPSLVLETNVDFEFVKKTVLEGKAGEVEIRGVEFNSARGKGGFFSSGDAELQAGIVTKLEYATSADKKQKLDRVMEAITKGAGDK